MKRNRATRPLTILAALGILTLAAWLVTHESWTFFLPTGWAGPRLVFFYDEQARSLLDGRWDVPLYAIQGEAFIVRGKSYGYFGFFPAIPRIALNWLSPSHFGQWSRCSMLLSMASLLGAFFALLALFDAPTPWEPLILIALLCGTTAIFLSASDLVYHEAIAWGSALAIWAYTGFGWYLKTGRALFLCLGLLAALAALFTRNTSGAGTLLCAGLILLDRIRLRPFPKVHCALLAACLIAAVAGMLAINHAKFGGYLDFHPARYNVQYTPQRLAHIQGTVVHPEYVPRIAATYLNPANIALTAVFPFVAMTQRTNTAGLPLDGVEPYASFPAAMPAACVLAALGMLLLFRPQGRPHRWCLPILFSALAALPVFCSFTYLSYRYLHDLFPFLFIAGILGAAHLAQLRPPLRTALLTVLVLATIWSAWANVAFVYQLQTFTLFSS